MNRLPGEIAVRYILGIDGGGTETDCVLSDEHGNILQFSSGPPSSYVGVGETGQKNSLEKTVRSILKKISIRRKLSIDLIYAGISGINKTTPREVKKRVGDTLNHLTSAKRIIFDDDCDLGVAFDSSLEVDMSLPRIVVLAGTGMGIMGMNLNGERKSMHGWGPLMGDEGSGHDIGLKALREIARAFDGRGEETKLAAIDILRTTGEELGERVNLIAKGLSILGEEFQVIPVCGVFKAGDYVLNPLREVILRHSPGAKILPPVFLPVTGAVIQGLKIIGVKINDEIKSNLSRGIKKWKT